MENNHLNKGLAETIEDNLIITKEHLERLINLKEEAKKLKFRIGEIALHKKYGNCLILNEYLPGIEKILPYSVNHTVEDFSYLVSTISGTHIVKELELFPITETSRILYGK